MKTNDAIAVIGTGYVGATTATCLAHLGNRVIGFDIAASRIGELQRGVLPFVEPGLAELMAASLSSGRLSFTCDLSAALSGASMAFICVGTPMAPSGEADTSQVIHAARRIAQTADHPVVVVIKSTVPPGSTADAVADALERDALPGVRHHVAANPEFLREGSAIHDFFNPDRVVIGSRDIRAAEAVAALYEPLRKPVLITDPATAHLIKYAANAFLAAKISFINEISRVSESLGADVDVVAAGIGLDARIGGAFLEAGLGYGGSCFPKDTAALAHIARSAGHSAPLLHAIMDVNREQRRHAVRRLAGTIGGLEGKTIGVLGLAFKPNTDDVRESPALDIIESLRRGGASVAAYDPVAIESARRVLPAHVGLRYCEDARDAAARADALVIATEWEEFRALDWRAIKRAMNGSVLFDGRSLLDPATMSALGFRYLTIAG